jgi:hypothetical protein
MKMVAPATMATAAAVTWACDMMKQGNHEIGKIY